MLKLEGTQLLLNFRGVIRARPPTCRERNETKKLAGMHIYLLAGCCACALSSCAAKVVAVSNGNFQVLPKYRDAVAVAVVARHESVDVRGCVPRPDAVSLK